MAHPRANYVNPPLLNVYLTGTNGNAFREAYDLYGLVRFDGSFRQHRLFDVNASLNFDAKNKFENAEYILIAPKIGSIQSELSNELIGFLRDPKNKKKVALIVDLDDNDDIEALETQYNFTFQRKFKIIKTKFETNGNTHDQIRSKENLLEQFKNTFMYASALSKTLDNDEIYNITHLPPELTNIVADLVYDGSEPVAPRI